MMRWQMMKQKAMCWLTAPLAGCFLMSLLLNNCGSNAGESAIGGNGGNERIVGVNYGPFRDGQSPLTGTYPTEKQMLEDMPILRKMAPYIRTYSVTHGLEQIPKLASQYGLKVVPTAWLGTNAAANNTEITNLIAVAKQNSNIPFVVVGSESLLRGDVTKSKLKEHIAYVKQRVSVPVATAEPWHVWRDNPDLAEVVDLIFINVHPYWEKQPIGNAVAYVLQRYSEIKAMCPTKRVILSETGWPSAGATNGAAVPSLENQRRFIQELIAKAAEKGLEFFLFEAFDEKWKKDVEGEVGAHWGFYDSARKPKHDFDAIYFGNLKKFR